MHTSQRNGMHVDASCLLQAYASVQLNIDLKFSDTVYGLGSGIFFLGYMVFQVSLGLTCCLWLHYL